MILVIGCYNPLSVFSLKAPDFVPKGFDVYVISSYNNTAKSRKGVKTKKNIFNDFFSRMYGKITKI
jgi:hypothetical protein